MVQHESTHKSLVRICVLRFVQSRITADPHSTHSFLHSDTQYVIVRLSLKIQPEKIITKAQHS